MNYAVRNTVVLISLDKKKSSTFRKIFFLQRSLLFLLLCLNIEVNAHLFASTSHISKPTQPHNLHNKTKILLLPKKTFLGFTLEDEKNKGRFYKLKFQLGLMERMFSIHTSLNLKPPVWF